MKHLLLSGLIGCMLMGQAFATQADADHLILIEQMPVDKESLLNTQLEQICEEMLQDATTATNVVPEAEVEKGDIAEDEQEAAEVTAKITEPVVIDRGSILEGCKKSLYNAPFGLAVSCAGIVAAPVMRSLLRLVKTHVNLRGTYVDEVVGITLLSAVMLSPVIAPFWTVPAACKAGKYREAIGSILATPILAMSTFYVMEKVIEKFMNLV